MYALYSVLIVAFFAVMSPYLVYQAVRYRKYIGSLPQRLGYLPISFNLDGDESIWIHAVSVGEVLTARALLPELRERYPAAPAVPVDDDDDGAADRAQQPAVCRRGLLLPVRPRLHREPHAAAREAAAVHHDGDRDLAEPACAPATAPGSRRCSSTGGSRRARIRAIAWRAPFFRRVLRDVDRFCMQSDESARRIIDIGADQPRVIVTGSLKFDSLEIPGAAGGDRGRNRVLRYFRISTDRPVIIAASTLKGEEEPVFEAFQRIRARVPDALLIIAPRKPERFDEVERWPAARAGTSRGAASCASTPSPAATSSSSTRSASSPSCIRSRPSCSSAAASSISGGHNILEPAVFGKPIVFGPHMQNFAEIARTFLDNGAAIQVRTGRELEPVLLDLLGDPVRRASLGRRRACARRSQPRRPQQDPRRHRAAPAPATTEQRRAPVQHEVVAPSGSRFVQRKSRH